MSPVTKVVAEIVSLMPPVWPFNKAAERLKGFLAADSIERIRLMLETCLNEVLKHEKQIQEILRNKSAKELQEREETSRELLLDAARKAESTRAKERVRRIGLILANSIMQSKPTDADETEEMMRVAMELSDRDIEFLRELIKIEGSMLDTQDHIERYQAHTRWQTGFWGARIDPEIDSVFSKLESYGLVARIPPPNNLNIMADYQNQYVLLMKGKRFAALIRGATADH